MIYILYNEKSNGGKPARIFKRLKKKLSKIGPVCPCSLLDLNGKEKAFIQDKTKKDWIVLLGGDGTVHHFLNQVYPEMIFCRVFVKACGRGNDLARDYRRRKIFEITHLVNDLPTLKINDQSPGIFINGMGMGVDSHVCEKQIENAKTGIRPSYYAIALKVFKKFKPYSLDLTIDGQDYHFDNVWFFVCNNGKYFGGGMKITPEAVREDEYLDVCVVHSLKLFLLLLVFPLVFIGKHTWFYRRSIAMIRGKHILIRPNGCTVLQQDGEINRDVVLAEISR